MTFNESVSYRVVLPGVVEIERGGEEPFRLNRDNLLLAIRNIKSGTGYRTEEARQANLKVYQDALAYLDSHAQVKP